MRSPKKYYYTIENGRITIRVSIIFFSIKLKSKRYSIKDNNIFIRKLE